MAKALVISVYILPLVKNGVGNLVYLVTFDVWPISNYVTINNICEMETILHIGEVVWAHSGIWVRI